MMKKREEKEKHTDKANLEKDLKADIQGNPETASEIGVDEQKEEQALGSGEEPGIKEAEFEAQITELKANLAGMNDRYLRLSAEFDNFRKRTLKEKMELTKTASESVLTNIISVIDDFDRAIQAISLTSDIDATKEGISLIYNKFKEFTKQNGVNEIDAVGKDFNTDVHEAITKIPAPSEEMKGKIVDVIQKGYYLNDKVIRFAKVVIGE
jgi:molecular chaperone GrpE